MALLSQMIRTVAITGSADHVNAWFADRQGGRWAEQKIQAAFPSHPRAAAIAPPPPSDPSRTLEALTELERRGVVSGAEAGRLRARLGL